MINLSSTTDVLRVETSTAAAVQAHVSFVDLVTATGVVTPGSTNTIISSATTTTICASPASGTIRNIKYVNIWNDDATLTCLCEIHHVDAAAHDVALWSQNLAVETGFQYDEGNGWSAMTIPTVDVQVFTSAGANTWTKPTWAKVTKVMLWGGGGGGGAGAGVATNLAVKMPGCGGGGGAFATEIYNSADLAGSVTVTVGAAGSAGAKGAAGALGGDGGVFDQWV